MFVWMKLLGIEDSTPVIKKRAVEAKVLLVPGGVPFEIVLIAISH